jgi:hypothetical protein
MSSFLFGAAKLPFLQGQLSFRTTSFGIVPVEVTPSAFAGTYEAITGIATAVGGGSLAKPLLDIEGNNSNRVFNDVTNNRVALRFAPIEWTALATANGAPITGLVIVDNTTPSSSSIPVFYIEIVDELGDPQPFTPDGVDSLSLDLTAKPVAVREYGGNVFDLYLREWISGNRYPGSTTLSLIYCEAAPNPTWETLADVTGRATLPGGGSLYSWLADIDALVSNRPAWVGVANGTAGYRFESVLLPDFQTETETDITHYVLVEGNPPESWSNVVSWNTINPALTATGVNNYRLSMVAGSTLTL